MRVNSFYKQGCKTYRCLRDELLVDEIKSGNEISGEPLRTRWKFPEFHNP